MLSLAQLTIAAYGLTSTRNMTCDTVKSLYESETCCDGPKTFSVGTVDLTTVLPSRLEYILNKGSFVCGVNGAKVGVSEVIPVSEADSKLNNPSEFPFGTMASDFNLIYGPESMNGKSGHLVGIEFDMCLALAAALEVTPVYRHPGDSSGVNNRIDMVKSGQTDIAGCASTLTSARVGMGVEANVLLDYDEINLYCKKDSVDTSQPFDISRLKDKTIKSLSFVGVWYNPLVAFAAAKPELNIQVLDVASSFPAGWVDTTNADCYAAEGAHRIAEEYHSSLGENVPIGPTFDASALVAATAYATSISPAPMGMYTTAYDHEWNRFVTDVYNALIVACEKGITGATATSELVSDKTTYTANGKTVSAGAMLRAVKARGNFCEMQTRANTAYKWKNPLKPLGPKNTVGQGIRSGYW